jgi:hypothetical protein
MTPEEFINIILTNPKLTTHGIGMVNGSQETFEEERANLATCYDQALACEEFLRLCKKTKHPHKGLGSTYHFKHVVERYKWPLYVREGALIIAAIHLGFQMRQIPNRTSVYLNISKKTKINGNWIHCF